MHTWSSESTAVLCFLSDKFINAVQVFTSSDHNFNALITYFSLAGSSVKDSESLNDRIIKWKREHSSGSVTRAYVSTVWILIFKSLLAQVFVF